MHIPATILYLSILYVVFQSIFIALSIAAGTVIIACAVFILVTGDSTKSLRYTANLLSLLVLVIPCLAILWDFYLR